ncbi:MAG: aminotransferase class I/II-fold pyridoxal phosphate-dependent enzyme [Bacteroidia bacterium]
MIIEPANRLSHIQEYYFATKLRELRNRMSKGEDIINLGIGSPDMMPSDETIKTLIHTSVEPAHHGYQPYKGIPRLRMGFAQWYQNTYGVELNPETEILPLMGSKEGIMHISLAFLNPGDHVLVPDPGYPTYVSNTRMAGAEPVFYPLSEETNWAPDLDALEKLDLSRVKLMWVNYPHMPTGANGSPDLFEKLVDFGRRNQILICHDNPYSLVLNDHPVSILEVQGARDCVVELNSLSKSHNMAGWRVGMVAGRQDYIDTILRVKSNMDSGMFLPLQEAAATALENGYEWHRERNSEYQVRRRIVEKMLDALNCTFNKDQVGMFVWARIPESEESGEAFSDLLLDKCSVFLTPGFVFGGQGHRYIRASLCTPKERLQEALTRILEFQLEVVK